MRQQDIFAGRMRRQISNSRRARSRRRLCCRIHPRVGVAVVVAEVGAVEAALEVDVVETQK